MKLFSKTSILLFSIIGSTLFGALLFSDNLKQADKSRHIAAVVLFAVVWNILLIRLLSFIPIPFLPFGIANISGGIILIGPAWKHHLGEYTTFQRRKIWGPLLSLVILYGAIFSSIYFYGRL